MKEEGITRKLKLQAIYSHRKSFKARQKKCSSDDPVTASVRLSSLLLFCFTLAKAEEGGRDSQLKQMEVRCW